VLCIVLFSSIVYEDLCNSDLFDGCENNMRLEFYTKAMVEVCESAVVDLVCFRIRGAFCGLVCLSVESGVQDHSMLVWEGFCFDGRVFWVCNCVEVRIRCALEPCAVLC